MPRLSDPESRLAVVEEYLNDVPLKDIAQHFNLSLLTLRGPWFWSNHIRYWLGCNGGDPNFRFFERDAVWEDPDPRLARAKKLLWMMYRPGGGPGKVRKK